MGNLCSGVPIRCQQLCQLCDYSSAPSSTRRQSSSFEDAPLLMDFLIFLPGAFIIVSQLAVLQRRGVGRDVAALARCVALAAAAAAASVLFLF